MQDQLNLPGNSPLRLEKADAQTEQEPVAEEIPATPVTDETPVTPVAEETSSEPVTEEKPQE
jgi:hypothetical protein